MRKAKLVFLLALAALVAACVTINVYFPAAAAEAAAEKFIGNVIGPSEAPAPAPAPAASSPVPPAASGGGMAVRLLDLLVPAAHAAGQAPDLRISTPELEALRGRMRARYTQHLQALLDSGAIGFTHDGEVAMRDAASVPLAQRNQVRQWVQAENADRNAVYKQVAEANGHPEWAGKIRQTFARQWREMAHKGWYVQDAAGTWQQK